MIPESSVLGDSTHDRISPDGGLMLKSFADIFMLLSFRGLAFFRFFFLEIFCGLFFDSCSIFVRNVGVTRNPNLVKMERRRRRRSPNLRNRMTSKI